MSALLLGLWLLQLLSSVSGHAVLLQPPARNYVAYKKCLGGVNCPADPPNCPGDGTRKVGCRDHNYCSAQAGGPGAVSGRGKAWPSPVGSHGLCGDPIQTRNEVKNWKDEPYMYKTPPQATYTGGETIEIEIGVCTEHRGMYVFSICDKPLDADNFETQKDAQDCLNKWHLKRAPPSGSGGDALPIDDKHPERWYIPGGSTVAGINEQTPIADEHWDSDRDYKQWMNGNDTFPESLLQQQRLNTPTSSHKIRMIVPEGLSCTRCTLQWWWVSGNNCGYDADYNSYFTRNGLPGKAGKVCDASFTGEEFWNCADITVKAKPAPPGRRRTTRRRTPPTPKPAPPTPPPPYPPGCSAGCSDENAACKPENCNWGDYWQNQCQKTCEKCKPCSPAPPPVKTTTSPPAGGGGSNNGSRRRSTRRRSTRRRSPARRRTPRRRTRRRSTRRRSPRRRSQPPGDNNDGGGRRRKSSPSPPPGPPKEPRYDCKPSSKFSGDVAQYATKSFCECDYGGSAQCSFICGGTKPNHGGNCGPAACSERLIEFDAENTYIINVKLSEGKDGSPYRAFAYMKDVKVPSATTFSFTFKANGHSKVYSKLFFWGDGNNILGLQPTPGGGTSTFCFMPSTDAPVSMVKCKGGSMPCKDDTWYRVDLKLTPPSSMALSINGQSIGTGSIQGFSGMPMIGVYHWGGMDKDYQLRYRDMCLGDSSLTNR